MCTGKEPQWFTDKIRQILNKKNEFFKQFINNGKLQSDYDRLQCIRRNLVELGLQKKNIIFVYWINYLIHPHCSKSMITNT